jgi:hypothetical protein
MPLSKSVGLVLPISGHPLCVHQIEERVETSPDGTSVTQTATETVYRDAAGRVRTEAEQSTASREPAAAQITIVDPVGGVLIVMQPGAKTAIRLKLPTSPQPKHFGSSLPGPIDPLPDGKWNATTETVGKRLIQGQEFDGTRITNVSEGHPPVNIVYEYWTSETLGIVGFAKTSGPRGEHTAKVQHIDLHVPDAALFTVPQDYTVQEMNWPALNPKPR